MIARVFESEVVPDGVPAFSAWIAEKAWPTVTKRDGFLGGAVYRDLDPTRSRIYIAAYWRDEEAIASYIGQDWRSTPLVDEEERALMVGEPLLSHYLRLRVTP
jgi:quinol monooxygenase YgiN